MSLSTLSVAVAGVAFALGCSGSGTSYEGHCAMENQPVHLSAQGGGCCGSGEGKNIASTQPSTQQSDVYVCPMHLEVTSDKPGKCPKCDMNLVKKEKK